MFHLLAILFTLFGLFLIVLKAIHDDSQKQKTR